jgi:hypothetical protein
MKEKTVVITGATSGLGRATALQLGNTDLIPDHFYRCRSIPEAPVNPYHITLIQTHMEKISI